MSMENITEEEAARHHHLTRVQLIINQTEADCYGQIQQETEETLQGYCPPVWDGLICWKKSFPNTNNSQPCPDYVHGVNLNGSAFKYCMPDATWYYNPEKNPNTNSTWTDFTQCSNYNNNNYYPPSHPYIFYQEWIPVIKKISQVGYGVSFVTLLLAFFILVSIKKLRCPRNTLHMHLFASFMLRAFMALLKDMLFREGIGLSSTIFEGDEGLISFKHDQPNWECKLLMSLWQYFMVANYTWILMEGLYLHNLIFLAPFSDSSAITLYVLLGWGCPLPVVAAWVTIRATLEDTYCWTTNTNTDYFLIIRIPVILTIVLNFIFFLNIVRVLLLKLQSAVSIETRKYRYRKWAKSTLVLVPLFGVHYMIFLWMSSHMKENDTIEVVWLFCDQLFASFQGFFVAILYCLINGEVRQELSKKWSQWRSETDSKNIWVPLNQISSKFYHRSTRDGLMANNGSEPQRTSTCCHNPCGKGSRSSQKEKAGREGGESPQFITQTEEHHLTNTDMLSNDSPSSTFHDVCLHSSNSPKYPGTTINNLLPESQKGTSYAWNSSPTKIVNSNTVC